MKFLFGLLFGAALTMSLVTVFNVPIRALVDHAGQSWDQFLLAVGDAVFEFPELPADAPEIAVAEAAVPAEPIATQQIAADEDGDKVDDRLAAAVEQPPVDVEPQRVELPPGLVAEVDPPAQTVWTPFRSQMSAAGFAGRLSSELGHPFSVSREGPGRYQVVFSYVSELERLALLEQVQSVTIQDPQ